MAGLRWEGSCTDNLPANGCQLSGSAAPAWTRGPAAAVPQHRATDGESPAVRVAAPCCWHCRVRTGEDRGQGWLSGVAL